MNNIFDNKDGSGIFVQIGAGAGDLDERAGYRDGFTEFIKKLPYERVKKIILVEPNPINIPFLRKCWKDYPQVEIYQIAIVPKEFKNESVEIFYSLRDSPHYQVASIIKDHVLIHYNNDESIVKSFKCAAININDFLKKYIGSEEIEFISLDIEGIDSEIVLDINFNTINMKYISFEYIHMGNKLEEVKKHLLDNNFYYIADCFNYDYLYKKI